MKVCVPLLTVFAVALASLRGGDKGASELRSGNSGASRPGPPPFLPPPPQEKVSLQSLHQLMRELQRQVDMIAKDMAHTKSKVDQSSRHVEQLLNYLIKPSCSEVSAVDVPMPSTKVRPGVERQNSMEGVFAIFPPSGHVKRVKCDHADNGEPGWTVALYRFDGSVEFNRTYEEYKTGFGDPNGEVWIGLDTLHELTSAKPQKIRVELTNFAGKSAHATYSNFRVGDAASFYRLTVGAYLRGSTAGDALKDHSNARFSTKDVDNDLDNDGSCSRQFGGDGGWWFASCYHALGTGVYRKPTSPTRKEVPPGWGGVTWHPFSDVKHSLSSFKMLIKQQD